MGWRKNSPGGCVNCGCGGTAVVKRACTPCQVAVGSLTLSFTFRAFDGSIQGPAGATMTGGTTLVGGLSYQWTSPYIYISDFDPTVPVGSTTFCPYFRARFECSPFGGGLGLRVDWFQNADGTPSTDCDFIQYSGTGTVASCSPLSLTYGPTSISTTGAPRFYQGIVTQ